MESADTHKKCTNDLNITLTPLENDTLYQFIISAGGRGGEILAPDVFVFRTKPAGKMYSII